MNEISFYEEFSARLARYLQSYFGEAYGIYYSCNKTLDAIVVDLERQTQAQIRPENVYIPKLKVDVVFAVKRPDNSVQLALIEAKYSNQLSLMDYSQLVGYLQVAKSVKVGLLLLIQKRASTNKLSNDFSEIIRLRRLPMDWFVNMHRINEHHAFRTGIISYVPGNGIDWIDTQEINGISSFEELVGMLGSGTNKQPSE